MISEYLKTFKEGNFDKKENRVIDITENKECETFDLLIENRSNQIIE